MPGTLRLLLRRVTHHAGLSDGWMLELRCATRTDHSADSCPVSTRTGHSSADYHVQSGSV
jgi:hypothetical protein